MEDDDRRCPHIDWVIRIGQGRAHSRKKAAKVLAHIRNGLPGELCRDCHPLGEGYPLRMLMSPQEDESWRLGFAIIGGVEPGREPAPAEPRPPLRRPSRSQAGNAAKEESFRVQQDRDAAIDAEIRRLWRQMEGVPKFIQDLIFRSVLHPPDKSELH